MNRRGFLGSILAAAVSPAIVRADALMRIVPRETLVLDNLLMGEVASPCIEAGEIVYDEDFGIIALMERRIRIANAAYLAALTSQLYEARA